MSLTDDEVLARLRASFQETAARTPVGDGRLDELTIARLGKDRRTLVATFSAAAAVAIIAGTGVVLANVGTDGSVSPASGGLPAPAAACTPHNYYVIASKQQLAGMTYVLPAPPPGYTLYGAWGTIDRSLCPDTVNWYVEYDKVVDGLVDGRDTTWRDSTSPIQLQVAVATAPSGNGDALRGELGDLAPQPAPSVSSAMAAAASSAAAQASSAEAAASRAVSAARASGAVSSPSALPSAAASQASPGPGMESAAAAAWQTVTVDGHPGKFIGAKSGTGTLVWSDGNLLFQLNAPVVGGDSGSIVKLAEQLVAVAPSDPRIQPPANCDVPAGAVCPDARG